MRQRVARGTEGSMGIGIRKSRSISRDTCQAEGRNIWLQGYQGVIG